MLEIGLWLVTATVAGGAVGLWEARKERLRLQSLRDAAELCGLRVESTSIPFKSPLRIEARAGSTKLWIEDFADKGKKLRLQVRVELEGPRGFSGVRIRSETERPSGAREIEIGDERFDSVFYVEGPSRLVSVLLDAETRRLLVRVRAEGDLTIAGGEIRVKVADKDVAALLPLLLELAPRLSGDLDVQERLAENALQDPVSGVRLHNLLVLAREFPNDADMVKTLRAACSDPSPQVRLRAGMTLLGAEGRAAVIEVAEGLEDDDSSARAVAHLGRDLPVDRAGALLSQALRRRRLQTARACLEALGKSRDEAAVAALAKVLAVEKADLATVAALALGATGHPAAEPPLLEVLRRDEGTDLQIAAAQALGRAGTAAAVLPLKDAAESSFDLKLRRATRQAIAEIQSRLQGASPGQLSIAGDDAGQLSLTDARSGGLSLATDQDRATVTGGQATPTEDRATVTDN